MARAENPDFVEAIERGLVVIRALGNAPDGLALSQLAEATGLPRPTARRALVTLEMLGYVRAEGRVFRLTPRVLELGCAYVGSLGLWDVVRPHLQALVRRTGESSSMGQLDGSEIVYVGRVAVPKIITIAVSVGTRLPAASTSMGRVLLAALTPAELRSALSAPARGDVRAAVEPGRRELDALLAGVRDQGWAAVDQQLAAGVRSVAVPLRDEDRRTVAAVNVCVHAAEHSMRELEGELLPLLRETAGAIEDDLAARRRIPQVLVPTLERSADDQ
jgi:IclR family transcriptional regulator, pca regulon regulatory protein